MRHELEVAREEGGAAGSALKEERARILEEQRKAKGEMQEALRSLEAAEAERDRLSTQLARLKAQMVAEEEEEEDKVGWRLEKEVEALRQAHEGQLRALHLQHSQEASTARSLHLDEVSKLRAELERLHSQLRRTEEGSKGWEEIIEAKDRELANLQVSLPYPVTPPVLSPVLSHVMSPHLSCHLSPHRPSGSTGGDDL